MGSFFLGPLAAHPPFKESQVTALSSRAHHFDAMAFITGQVGLFRVADDALRIRWRVPEPPITSSAASPISWWVSATRSRPPDVRLVGIAKRSRREATPWRQRACRHNDALTGNATPACVPTVLRQTGSRSISSPLPSPSTQSAPMAIPRAISSAACRRSTSDAAVQRHSPWPNE